MASQIISRYIPPKKVKQLRPVENAAIEVSSSPSPNSTPPQPQPAASILDASSTYARYIPPKRKLEQECAPESKRHKKSEGREKFAEAVAGSVTGEKLLAAGLLSGSSESNSRDGRQNSKVDGEQYHKVKKSKKKESVVGDIPLVEELKPEEHSEPAAKVRKSKKDKAAKSVSQSPDSEEESSRHTKVLQKRDKSLRKAERRAAREAAEHNKEAQDDAGDIPEEPLYDLVPLPQPESVPESIFKQSSSSLPPWLATPLHVSPTSTATFHDLGVELNTVKNLQKKGFENAFAIQAAVSISI
jgi:ATP-dependent RNA helicase DDX51/DBP6